MIKKIKSIFSKKTQDSNRETTTAPDTGPPNIMTLLATQYDNGVHTEDVFKDYTEKDLLALGPAALADHMAKNDPLIDKVIDDFATYAIVNYEIKTEEEIGEDIIQQFIDLLERKRNTFTQLLHKAFTSMILRGELLVEIVFDENNMPSNLFVVDPQHLSFRKREDPVDGEVWDIGQIRDGEFRPITSEFVIWQSVNSLLETPRGRSMVASAFPSAISNRLMTQDLRKVVAKFAWIQRMISLDIIAMKQAGFERDEIEEAVAQSKENLNVWKNLKVDETPIMTSDVKFEQFQGAGGGGLSFVDLLDRVYTRKTINGAKIPPLMAGSNEFVAESSAEEQAIQYSTRVAAYQMIAEYVFGKVFTYVIRSQGVPGKAFLILQRSNANERRRESQIFDVMAGGFQKLTSSGASLELAAEIYEESTGTTFSPELKAKLQNTEAENNEQETSSELPTSND